MLLVGIVSCLGRRNMDWASMKALIPSAERHSPCVGACKLDEETGFCVGCSRTIDEIARWSSLDASARFAVWEQLPKRRRKEAKSARLMPHTPVEILRWAATTIEKRLGVWITGMPGASAAFIAAPNQTAQTELDSRQLIGGTAKASFRLTSHERMRAFAFEEGGPIVLGLPKAHTDWRPNSVLTKLGLDAASLSQRHRDHLLYDFGLGGKFSRFCIRTNDEALISLLEKFEGKPWQALMAAEGSQIIFRSPDCVVESALARIEVYATVLQANERPQKAQTQFLPALLAQGEDISPNLALPDYAAPIAIFYPSYRSVVANRSNLP